MIIDKIIEEIFMPANIAQAVEHLQKKNNSCGDDGVRLHEIEEYWKNNGDTIIEQINKCSYHPRLIHEKIIVTPNGKHRKIAMLSSIDRLIQRIILQAICEEVETEFSDCSFAYQNNKGIDKAIECATDYKKLGMTIVVEIDIQDFFDNINHTILLAILDKSINDKRLFALIKGYIKCNIESDYKLTVKERGILQGGTLSPMLSNIYLNEFDKWLEKQKYNFVRFSDNINIYVDNFEYGYRILENVRYKLLDYDLKCNEKSGVYSAFDRKYLGYVFESENGVILTKRFKNEKKFVYSKWHKDALERVGKDYHIVNDGILTRKDFSVLFEKDDGKINIPVEVADSINIYSNVELTSGFLEMLSHNRFNLNVFDKYGDYVGSFYAKNQRNQMRGLLKQSQIYNDEKLRMEYAKKMDIASIHNIRCNLRYYYKQSGNEMLLEATKSMSAFIKEMNETTSIEELLLIEARARQKYYGCFNVMINKDQFHFAKRTKRPPKDEINALISFGNVYLYSRIAQMIRKSSLDIRISFVHTALKRYENLNLDIAVIFKPIIVD